jgi:predicted Ser/Thr protein kinase
MDKVVEPVPGDILGTNYLIESELGRGGFGVVFKARHVDIERVVAIKVLLATYARKDPSAKERFRREATIAASLNYPNSLRVFDYGETGDGVFYLVMEFLKGTELTKLLQREGRLPIQRALHIIRQVLYALSEAHMRGIVHRDIKPDNIMLVELAYDPDHVKVMDFGIAKMVDSGEQITRAGITLGTPRYMPVEQLKGERLTPATDLYAVGLVLYEMLVGASAFDAATPVDLALQVMRGPTVKVPAEAGVPPALAQVIEKAAARDTHDRFQTAGEFLDALDIAATALGVLGPDDTALPPTRTASIGAPIKGGGGARTMVMPEVDRELPEGGDAQDILKTTTLDTEALRERAASHGLTRSERTAETQSLDVHVVREAMAAQAARAGVGHDTETATGAALTTSTFVRGPDGQPQLVVLPEAPAPAAGWGGAPPIVIVLQVATLVLLGVLLALAAT